MTKVVSFSCPDWIYDTYLTNIGNNRSDYIQEMIIKGAEVVSEDYAEDKQKILELSKKVTILKNGIADLQKENASLKYRLETKKQVKREIENESYSNWDKDNLSNEENSYWIDHQEIKPEFMHGQHKNYNTITAQNITFEEFKRRYEVVKNGYNY